MSAADSVPIGPGAALPLRYVNRHGLIAGATGTGKTVTLAALAERLAGAGVPVLMLDAKGDLGPVADRVLDPYAGAPVDLYQMGPDLICRALGLSEAQSGAVCVLYAWAGAEGVPLASLEHLRHLCRAAAADRERLSAAYGLLSGLSLAAVQRAVLRLEREGAGAFGRPGFDVASVTRGVTVLRCDRLARDPALYGAVAAHILLDLYRRAPEMGDAPRPRLALMIDEAHLLFDGAPADLVRRIESAVRLIRSKGIGVYFATQSPADLPDGVAGQLATRIQHGLRAATPRQLKALRAAADTMPQRPGFDAAEAIKRLRIGEALVSVPAADGTPTECQPIRVAMGRRRV